jgi:hypothetical protein
VILGRPPAAIHTFSFPGSTSFEGSDGNTEHAVEFEERDAAGAEAALGGGELADLFDPERRTGPRQVKRNRSLSD